MLDGDVTLQPVVLGVDQRTRDTLHGRISGQEFGGILQVAGLQVADAGVVFGKIARRGRAVLLDHLEEAGAVGIAFECQRIVRILILETVLRLGDHLGGLLGTRRHDQCAVAENEGCEHQQAEENIRQHAAVLLEEKLSFVHCFAEGFLLGDMLFCHKNLSCLVYNSVR